MSPNKVHGTIWITMPVFSGERARSLSGFVTTFQSSPPSQLYGVDMYMTLGSGPPQLRADLLPSPKRSTPLAWCSPWQWLVLHGQHLVDTL